MPLKLVTRHGGENFYLRGTIRGIRVDESTGISDRKAAEEIRALREAELLTQSIHGKQATATFAQAALSYLENGGAKPHLAKVIAYFGHTPLARISQESLDIGARKLFPNGGPATRNRQFFTPASAVLHHAAKRGWVGKPVIERPRQPEGRVRWIPIDEADRLLDACADHLRPLVLFMLYTGARTGEALWLEWKDLDLERSHVQFIDTKNGEARGVPLHSRLVAALSALEERTGEVFRKADATPYGRPKGGDDHSAGTRIKSGFAGACRRAGIADFTPHDCRHTWATWHYRANRDLGALQKLGGWKSVAMVLRYAHTNVDELSHTINALPGGKDGGENEDKPINH